jgi:predicted phage replisome organizer
MMAEVQWIKLIVGMFDGDSFKRIKRARIGGERYRDKLTAIWFELLELAGRCNQGGRFISPRGIPYSTIEDIAVQIDREADELDLCMTFFINDGMIEIVNGIYGLTNWDEHQNETALEVIREQNRERKRKQRERQKQALLEDVSRDCHVTVTEDKRECHAIEEEGEGDKEKETHSFTLCVSEEEMSDPDKRRKYLGGIGKGAAADELIRYLETSEISHGLVSVGGTIGVFGDKPDGTPYKIGVRDPDDPNGVVTYLHIRDGFVAVSGDYERYFEEDGVRYHHIFDPYTGIPADGGLRETAVYCTSGAVADALSTALFVMGKDASLSLYESGGFEAVLVSSDGSITATEGLRTEYVVP